jgi:hypothetical protein
MELIIFIAIVVVAALVWVGHMKSTQAQAESKIDNWIPGGPGKNPDQHPLARFNATDVAPGKSADDRVEATAPQCGCGRSPTGFCVGLHKLTAEEWAVSDQNPNKASVAEVTADNKAAAVAKVKKAPAKKTADKKPAAKRAPAKKKST